MNGRTAGAVTAIGILALGAVAWLASGQAPPHLAPAEARHPRIRRDLLIDLRDRLVPTSKGGWTAATPGEPVLEVWLRAAAAGPGGTAFDQALAEAERTFADDADGRSLGLVLAAVLPGPASDRSAADRVARQVLDRALARIDREPGWLGPLLQLSAGTTSSSSAATTELVRRAGPGSCARLPASGKQLPDPATSLTVVLRVLAASGVRCERALATLDGALRDPDWNTWIASSELADLARLVPSLPTSTRRHVARRLAGFLAVTPQAPIDLGALTDVQAARRALGLGDAIPAPLARHVGGQVAHRGGLPGRSTSPPTAFDVAIVRQLVGEAMVPDGALRSTEEAAAWPDVTGAVDPVVDRLLVSRAALRCSAAPTSPDKGARPTFQGMVAEQAWAIVREHCAGHLDLPAAVRSLSARSAVQEPALHVATAELAACRIDPSLLPAVAGRRLPAVGPFATDPIQIWARAVAADPVAACAAVRR